MRREAGSAATGQDTAEKCQHDPDTEQRQPAPADRLVDRGLATPDRLYWTGISNGAMMTMRLMLQAPDRVSGAATVAGSLPAPFDGGPAEPVPVLVQHGTADPLVPYGGDTWGSYCRL